MISFNDMYTTTQTTYAPSPIGGYVKYKGTLQVIVDFNEDVTMVKILDPKTQVKLNVSTRNVSATQFDPMPVVTHKGKDYLVSVKGLIISLTTGRVMKWDASNGDRKAILAQVS
ncbi:MAG: hypothetical protein HRT61_00725 [Ekhidna sp.]|nr:hypothetical protein [Ekhidna sp.]